MEIKPGFHPNLTEFRLQWEKHAEPWASLEVWSEMTLVSFVLLCQWLRWLYSLWVELLDWLYMEPPGPQSRVHCTLLDNFYHKNTDISYLIDLQEHQHVLKGLGEHEHFFHPKINLGIVKRYSGTMMAQPAWKMPKHALEISCGIWLSIPSTTWGPPMSTLRTQSWQPNCWEVYSSNQLIKMIQYSIKPHFLPSLSQ